MTSRGFKGFRLPQKIEKDALATSLERMKSSIDGRFIYWTGEPYRARQQSLRSNALRTLTEKRRPIPLKTWIERAARCVSDEVGYSPERVREGLYLHRNSKPAVFFELKKDARGNYVSVNDVPYASGYPKGLKAGDIVVSARSLGEGKALPKGKKPAPELPAPQPTEGEQPQA